MFIRAHPNRTLLSEVGCRSEVGVRPSQLERHIEYENDSIED